MTPTALKNHLDRKQAEIVDLRPSRTFRRGHVTGARWSIRPRLGDLALDTARRLILTAETPDIAALAALDLRELGIDAPWYLPPDVVAWREAGLSLETSETPGDAEAIDFLSFVHDRHTGNKEAMRGYLAWETALVAQLDAQERAVFDLEPLSRRTATLRAQ